MVVKFCSFILSSFTFIYNRFLLNHTNKVRAYLQFVFIFSCLNFKNKFYSESFKFDSFTFVNVENEHKMLSYKLYH